jgi:DNA polymerase-3 subunit epsilon
MKNRIPVDIETTGGNASGSSITEIAIIIHNGTNIIDRWKPSSERKFRLPFFLTGINNEMVL